MLRGPVASVLRSYAYLYPVKSAVVRWEEQAILILSCLEASTYLIAVCLPGILKFESRFQFGQEYMNDHHVGERERLDHDSSVLVDEH